MGTTKIDPWLAYGGCALATYRCGCGHCPSTKTHKSTMWNLVLHDGEKPYGMRPHGTKRQLKWFIWGRGRRSQVPPFVPSAEMRMSPAIRDPIINSSGNPSSERSWGW